MLDIEKQFCECYGLEERAITDTECLKLLELLIIYFNDVKITNVGRDAFLGYKILSESPTEQEYPFVGNGDDIKSVILKHCINKNAYENEEFKNEVHGSFIKFGQRVKEALDDAFGEILHN